MEGFGNLFDSIRTGYLWTMNLDFIITYISKGIEDYGWKRIDLISKKVIILNDTIIEDYKETMRVCIEDHTKILPFTLQQELNRGDGEGIYHIETVIDPCLNENGNLIGLCGFSRDISDRIESDKMKYVMEICGGICHELAQPFQVITGCSDMLKHFHITEDNKKIIESLGKQLTRVRALVLKLQNIKTYTTKEYLAERNSKILDIDASSETNKEEDWNLKEV